MYLAVLGGGWITSCGCVTVSALWIYLIWSLEIYCWATVSRKTSSLSHTHTQTIGRQYEGGVFFFFFLCVSPTPAIGWLSANHAACGNTLQTVLHFVRESQSKSIHCEGHKDFLLFLYLIIGDKPTTWKVPVTSSRFFSSCRWETTHLVCFSTRWATWEALHTNLNGMSIKHSWVF